MKPWFKITSSSGLKADQPKSYLQHLWNNTKTYWYFIILFVLIFHVLGSFVAGMTWQDIFPMYCILGAIALTFIIYYARDWQRIKDKEQYLNHEQEDD